MTTGATTDARRSVHAGSTPGVYPGLTTSGHPGPTTVAVGRAAVGPGGMGDTDELVDRVRRRLVSGGATATPASVAAAVRAERGASLGDAGLLALAGRLRGELTGAGPLTSLLADADVTDVLVNGGDGEVWVDRGTGLARAAVRLGGADEVRRLAQRLASACGRRLDDANPYVDARLPDGTRLHAVLPPVAARGPYLSLRTFRHRAFTLAELVAAGTVAPEAAPLVAALVAARLAYLISGGTGSGKTTMLATMLGLVPADERIVIVEDATELRPTHPHAVGLEARPANVEGSGAVSLRDLVRQALRMRPDRLVVGECRGAEVVELLAALNTGHEGGAGTLHANAAGDVPARLEALGAVGGLGREALHAQVAAALQAVLHLRRTPTGRILHEIGIPVRTSNGSVAVVAAWRYGHGPGPAAPHLATLLAARDVPVPPALTTNPTAAGSNAEPEGRVEAARDVGGHPQVARSFGGRVEGVRRVGVS